MDQRFGSRSSAFATDPGFEIGYHQRGTVDSSHATYLSFDELREALNPLIDANHAQFHRFQDLPLELRYMVYEEYFRDSIQHLVRHWPDLRLPDWRIGPTAAKTVDLTLLLPKLCLMDNTVGEEAGAYLFRNGKLISTCAVLFRIFIASLDRVHGGRLLDEFREIEIEYSSELLVQEICFSVVKAFDAHSISLACLSHVRELHLKCRTDWSNMRIHDELDVWILQPVWETVGRVLVTDWTWRLDLKPEFATNSLRRLVLSFTFHGRIEPNGLLPPPYVSKVLERLGCWFKEGYKNWGTEVVVRVYGEPSGELITWIV